MQRSSVEVGLSPAPTSAVQRPEKCPAYPAKPQSVREKSLVVFCRYPRELFPRIVNGLLLARPSFGSTQIGDQLGKQQSRETISWKKQHIFWRARNGEFLLRQESGRNTLRSISCRAFPYWEALRPDSPAIEECGKISTFSDKC